MSQAIKDGKINSNLFAIDCWEGDSHAGHYKDDVLKKVKKIINKHYKGLKIFIKKKYFEEALNDFDDDSIDLLHIDGLHTYEAVKKDFFDWLPKMSKDGIILLHDTVEKRDDFGVYKFWEEISQNYKTINFENSYGLGVIFLGKEIKIKKEMLDNYRLNGFRSYSHELRRQLEKLAELNKDKDNWIIHLEKDIELLNTYIENNCPNGLKSNFIDRMKNKYKK